MSESQLSPPFDLTEGARFGIGFHDTLPVAVPAAGNVASIQFDNQYVVRLLSVTVKLVTDAVVANRQIQLSVTDQNGNPFWTLTNPVTQAASLTQLAQFLNGYAIEPSFFAGDTIVPLPDILLPRNAKMVASVLAIDPGDQISISPVFVEKYPHGAAGYPTGRQRLYY